MTLYYFVMTASFMLIEKFFRYCLQHNGHKITCPSCYSDLNLFSLYFFTTRYDNIITLFCPYCCESFLHFIQWFFYI